MNHKSELAELIPDPEVLLSLEPEQLAGRLLQIMNGENRNYHTATISHWDSDLFDSPYAGYDRKYKEQVFDAIAEAWGWLESQGLIVWMDASNGKNGWRKPSRRGAKLANEVEFKKYLHGRALPREFLHPSLSENVWIMFLSGEYDTAVFQAFKQVEVAVRRAGKFGDEKYGVTLMRDAFGEGGPLVDKDAIKSEREALTHLFAGALGYYKNPQSHRDVGITEPAEARELILLASHLLRIVDVRMAN